MNFTQQTLCAITTIICALGLFFLFQIWKQRNHHFLKPRGPKLLLLSGFGNISIIFVCYIQKLLDLEPFGLVADFMLYSLVVVPYFLRALHYRIWHSDFLRRRAGWTLTSKFKIRFAAGFAVAHHFLMLFFIFVFPEFFQRSFTLTAWLKLCYLILCLVLFTAAITALISKVPLNFDAFGIVAEFQQCLGCWFIMGGIEYGITAFGLCWNVQSGIGVENVVTLLKVAMSCSIFYISIIKPIRRLGQNASSLFPICYKRFSSEAKVAAEFRIRTNWKAASRYSSSNCFIQGPVFGFMSFDELFENQLACTKLKDFARAHFVVELTEFLFNVHEYKKINEDNLTALHRQYLCILNEFIFDGAPYEVNIPYGMRARVSVAMKPQYFCKLTCAGRHKMFDKCEEEVKKLLMQNLVLPYGRDLNWHCSIGFKPVRRHSLHHMPSISVINNLLSSKVPNTPTSNGPLSDEPAPRAFSQDAVYEHTKMGMLRKSCASRKRFSSGGSIFGKTLLRQPKKERSFMAECKSSDSCRRDSQQRSPRQKTPPSFRSSLVQLTNPFVRSDERDINYRGVRERSHTALSLSGFKGSISDSDTHSWQNKVEQKASEVFSSHTESWRDSESKKSPLRSYSTECRHHFHQVEAKESSDDNITRKYKAPNAQPQTPSTPSSQMKIDVSSSMEESPCYKDTRKRLEITKNNTTCVQEDILSVCTHADPLTMIQCCTPTGYDSQSPPPSTPVQAHRSSSPSCFSSVRRFSCSSPENQLSRTSSLAEQMNQPDCDILDVSGSSDNLLELDLGKSHFRLLPLKDDKNVVSAQADLPRRNFNHEFSRNALQCKGADLTAISCDDLMNEGIIVVPSPLKLQPFSQIKEKKHSPNLSGNSQVLEAISSPLLRAQSRSLVSTWKLGLELPQSEKLQKK